MQYLLGSTYSAVSMQYQLYSTYSAVLTLRYLLYTTNSAVPTIQYLLCSTCSAVLTCEVFHHDGFPAVRNLRDARLLLPHLPITAGVHGGHFVQVVTAAILDALTTRNAAR